MALAGNCDVLFWPRALSTATSSLGASPHGIERERDNPDIALQLIFSMVLAIRPLVSAPLGKRA